VNDFIKECCRSDEDSVSKERVSSIILYSENIIINR